MWIKHFIIIFLLCISTGVIAQKKINTKHPNLENFERDRFHFGFSLGSNVAGFNYKYDLTTYDSLIGLTVDGQSGFNIGLNSSFRFNRYFTLRFVPSLAFAQRDVNYQFANEPRNINDKRIVESTYIFFPLLVKYRSERAGNFAAYVIGGGSLGFDVSSQFDVNNEVIISEQVLKVQRQNYFAEFGFGTDFFLEYFKFSIELKYSHGLNNVLVKDGSFWQEPIQEIKPKMFTVTLHFEG